MTRRQVDGRMIDVGVTQRVDGSESEKKAIKDVLKRMDNYFFDEVLAMPEYEDVRPRCKNLNEVSDCKLIFYMRSSLGLFSNVFSLLVVCLLECSGGV